MQACSQSFMCVMKEEEGAAKGKEFSQFIVPESREINIVL